VNAHLSDEKLIGYVHYTLTDADRETMDEHLKDCPGCRARFAELEALQRRVRYGLAADMRAVSLPSSLTFSAIAPRLERRRWWSRLRISSAQYYPGAVALAALAGLAVAVVSLYYGIGRGGAEPASVATSRLPLVACACFGLAVLGQYQLEVVVPPRLLLTRILALCLWLGTAIVGLEVIVTALDVLTWLLYLGVSPKVTAVGVWMTVPLSILWIAVVVGGGEYHYRNVGQRSSWRLFGLTIGFELLILAMPFLLGLWFSLPPIWR
jgi:predicted anti-sigma-YlaC factor YlaD